MNKAITRKKQYINDNTIESLSLRGAISQSLGNDVVKGISKDAIDQVIGIGSDERSKPQNLSGDLIEGQELVLSVKDRSLQTSQEENRFLDVEPGINYRREVLEGDKIIRKEDVRLVETKIEDILVEIKKLASAQEELEIEFREVAVEQRIVNPGKYHLNFFEWMLSVIRLARMKIEDSGAWLSAFQSKKAKRNYWAMFKKHGTTFGLSNERVVATQTG